LNIRRENALEHESHHHHHPHGTGMRWLDITLGVSATIVSLVSLWLGLHSAHSMEKLVAANSYPYVELSRSATQTTPLPGTDHKRNMVEYILVNNGVGPARVEWVEFSFKGKPVADLSGLLEACCRKELEMDKHISGMNRRGGITGALIRPGASVAMFTWNEQSEPSAAFDALHRQMRDIDFKTCYCSVFDECYTRVYSEEKPQAVKQCPAPAVQFRPRFRDD
jgi:hypothetical protein